MIQLSTSASQPHPAATLCAYAESIVRGRRVAVFGDALLGLGEGLVERGARLVHVYDPDQARIAVANAKSAGLKGARPLFALLDGDLGVRDGAFDVVLVPDLSILADPAEIVRRARRLLPPSGVALFAAPNPEADSWLLPPPPTLGSAPGYYELYDLVALQFAEVKMLGQAPFVGYALVDFAAEDPDVSVDTSILGEPEVPEWYVAVASERRVELDSYALVEIPLAEVARATVHLEPARGEPLTMPRGGGRLDRAASDAALEEAQSRIAELSSENERLAAEAKLSSIAEESRHKSVDALSVKVAELEKELGETKSRAHEAEGRTTEAHLRVERLTAQVRELDEELRRQRERSARLTKQLEDEKKRPSARVEEPAAARTRSAPAPALAVPRVSHGSTPPPPDLADARERAEARDRALSLLSELATRDARIAELEVALSQASEPPTLRSMQNAQSARIKELEQETATLEAKLAELGHLREVAESRVVERDRLLDSLRADVESARADVETARRAVEVQRRELELIHGKLEESRAEVSALRRELDAAQALIPELQRELAGAPTELALTEAHARELSGYEDALRERGRAIAKLERDLREAERIGRELVVDNEALRTRAAGAEAAGGAPTEGGEPGAGGDAPDSRAAAPFVARAAAVSEAELAELADRVARSQADLTAAGWRIAQLERELEARPSSPRPASEQQRELEGALVLAHRELAELRLRYEGQTAELVDAAHAAPSVTKSEGLSP